MPQVLRVEIKHRYRYVIPENPDHVVGQAQQLRQFAVLDAILGSSECVSDEVGRSVSIFRFCLQSLLPLKEHIIDLLQFHVLPW